ncbi:MAG: MFS transporter [Thermoplasmata archaeon]
MSIDIKEKVELRPSSNDLWFFAYLPLAISDGIATPLIPLLALQHFGASAFAVTLIIAASAMSQVPFTILWGNLSDRIAHRKYFLVGSFAATGVSIVLIALAQDLVTFFWLNVVEGLAVAASAPIGTMLLLETRQKRWWPTDIGLFGLISGLGTTVGLALGILWLFVVSRGQPPVPAMTALLLLSGALALLAAGIAWWWIEEPKTRIARSAVAELIHLNRGAIERLRHVRSRVLNIIELTRAPESRLPRREWIFLAAMGVMSVGFDLFYGPFPVFLWQTSHLSDASVFVVYLGAAAASTALFFHSGRAVEIYSPKSVFLGSLAARILLILVFVAAPTSVIFAFAGPDRTGAMTALNALMGVSWAFISTASTLFLIRLVGRAARGRALGLYNAVAGMGSLIGTVLGGWLFVAAGFRFTYILAAAVVGVGLLLLLPIPYPVFRVRPRLARRPPPDPPERAAVRPLPMGTAGPGGAALSPPRRHR